MIYNGTLFYENFARRAKVDNFLYFIIRLSTNTFILLNNCPDDHY